MLHIFGAFMDKKNTHDNQADFPVPSNEKNRITALEKYNILNSLPEQEYDDITLISAHICQMPIATIAMIDGTRKWHKSKTGIQKEFVPRAISICSHTIMQDDLLEVADTHQHEEFRHIGMVTQPPYVRFYAGVPLINAEGHALGTLCVVDDKPNKLNDFQKTRL